MEYALFTHKLTGKQIDHFNTHFCVCTDTISMCCGQDGQYQSAKEVQAAMELYHRPGNFTLNSYILREPQNFVKYSPYFYFYPRWCQSKVR